MDLYLLEDLTSVSEIIEKYSSVIWNLQFFGQGEFEMILPGNSANMAAITRGKMLVRDIDILENGYRNVMVVKNIEHVWDPDDGWNLIVTGKGLKSIVGQRIIWGQTNVTGNLETAVRQIITDNIINPSVSSRAISDFVLAPAAGLSVTADIQLLGENIASWLEQAGKTYGFGWDVEIQNGKFVFKLIQGTDRSASQNIVTPVVFSPFYDNLLAVQYRLNSERYANAALVGGEGEGTAKRTASIGTASGLDRYETYINGGSISSNNETITTEQYLALLAGYGQEELAKLALEEARSGTIVPNGMYTYGVDYFLGDIIQIQAEHSASAAGRITEMIFAVDENGLSIVPTIDTEVT